LSILDFAFFELNYPENRWYFYFLKKFNSRIFLILFLKIKYFLFFLLRSNSCDLTDMLDKYFKTDRVNARCKNMKCEKYPVRIMEAKRDRTLYFETKKYT